MSDDWGDFEDSTQETFTVNDDFGDFGGFDTRNDSAGDLVLDTSIPEGISMIDDFGDFGDFETFQIRKTETTETEAAEHEAARIMTEQEAARVKAEQEAAEQEAARVKAEQEAAEQEAARVKAEQEAAEQEVSATDTLFVTQDNGDEFGDFDSPSKTSGGVENEGGNDDFGDFGDFGGPTVTTSTTLSDSQPDTQDNGDEFGDFDSPSKTSGDVETEGGNDDFGDFGDFGGPTVTTSTTLSDSQPDTQDNGDEFGDFDSPSKTTEGVDSNTDVDFGDFGDFNNPDVKGDNEFEDNEFGNFETPVSHSEHVSPPQDDEFGDFGDFEDESSQQESGGNEFTVSNDNFGDFDDEEDMDEDEDITDPEVNRIKDLLIADNKSKYKFGDFFTKKNNLISAMSFPDNGADEHKQCGEGGPIVFSRVDMTTINAHFASTVAPSASSQSFSPPDSASWCAQRVLSAVKDTIPPDALESASLSQDTYQTLRMQQLNAGPDPHLEVSAKPRKTSTNSGTGFSGTSGKDMSTSGQAFQGSDAVHSSVSKATTSGDHAATRHSAPLKSAASVAGPSSAQAYLESLPDLSYMLTTPL